MGPQAPSHGAPRPGVPVAPPRRPLQAQHHGYFRAQEHPLPGTRSRRGGGGGSGRRRHCRALRCGRACRATAQTTPPGSRRSRKAGGGGRCRSRGSRQRCGGRGGGSAGRQGPQPGHQAQGAWPHPRAGGGAVAAGLRQRGGGGRSGAWPAGRWARCCCLLAGPWWHGVRCPLCAAAPALHACPALTAAPLSINPCLQAQLWLLPAWCPHTWRSAASTTARCGVLHTAWHGRHSLVCGHPSSILCVTRLFGQLRSVSSSTAAPGGKLAR